MYLLDSDTLTYLFDGDASVTARASEEPIQNMMISSLIVYEIVSGQMDEINRARGEKESLIKYYEFLCDLIKHLSAFRFSGYSENAEKLYQTFSRESKIKKFAFDARLMAHAQVIGATIVTHNLEHFSLIRNAENLHDVEIETWKKEKP